MNKIFFIFFLFIYSNFSHSIEIQCNFEEVYQDGSIQNGTFLIKNDKIRYEYQDERLYTLIGNKDNFFVINNLDRKIFQKIKKNNDTFDLIIDIYNDSPNFKNFYNSLNTSIFIEKSDKNFIRRISIKSNNTNLSLYFYNCDNINTILIFLSCKFF